jgi:hypothetical protein
MAMSDCLEANERAVKLRSDHKLQQAREQSLVCTAPSCPRGVREVCEQRVAALTAAIPSIVFEAKDASGNDVRGVAVTMDGQPFAERLDGFALAVDPGEHTFSFSAPGLPAVEKHVVVYEGEKDRHERVRMGEPPAPQSAVTLPPVHTAPAPVSQTAPAPPAPPAPPAMAPGAATPAAPDSPRMSPGLGTQRSLGLVLGGTGVAAVGVGSVFGLLTISAWSKVTHDCAPSGASNCPTTNEGAATSNDNAAKTDGTIATIAFVAGGALLATGAILFLTANRRSDMAIVPSVGPGQAGVGVRSSF